jgi:hypothetical protein
MMNGIMQVATATGSRSAAALCCGVTAATVPMVGVTWVHAAVDEMQCALGALQNGFVVYLL